MEENDRVNRTVLHYGLRGKPFGRAARKAQVGPTRVGSDDSDSCTTTSPFDDDVERARVRRSFNTSRKGLDHRAARKSLPSVVMVGSDDSDSWSTTTSHIGESESDTEDSEIQVIEPPVFTSRTTGALRTCSGSILTPQEIRSDEAPTLELVQALKGCVLRLPEGRLPFLRRNLRVGFEATCKARRVETMVTSGERMTVETVYLYPIDTLDERRYGSLTRKLEHLEWDHAEVKMRWTNSREEGKVTKWMIEIILPLPSKPGKDLSYIHPNFVFATYVRNPAILELTSLATTHDLRHMLGDKGKAREVSMGPELELRTSFTRKSARVDSKDTTLQSSKDAFTPDFDFKQLTGRYASPPRLNFEDSSDPPDPLGPTAQFPFLPAVSDDEKTTLNYSCRIGGPKIYDLLGTLSQEQFGTLSWVVLDREEEIFEVDDVKDEHKVMHALWARWIILHRMTFIRNYHDGVRMFIDQYWKMIRVAAGWEALRYWLLVLLANRFLTGHEVAELLKYYQKKVGWDESI
ncbi:hypothetical protein L218DRAFT_272438 [Marasmius fiardii PR-910]|nr:hypothetical protein L218DRAFT_272438 [Marasmius fiardii PR-910]